MLLNWYVSSFTLVTTCCRIWKLRNPKTCFSTSRKYVLIIIWLFGMFLRYILVALVFWILFILNHFISSKIYPLISFRIFSLSSGSSDTALYPDNEPSNFAKFYLLPFFFLPVFGLCWYSVRILFMRPAESLESMLLRLLVSCESMSERMVFNDLNSWFESIPNACRFSVRKYF